MACITTSTSKPALTLCSWNGNEFVEQVSADFVMFEVNGMYNYQYLQSVEDAKCVSQPQNWTSLLSQQQYEPNPNTAWTRNVCTHSITIRLNSYFITSQ